MSIAYQVVGDGPLDLVLVNGWVSHLEVAWEHPVCARFLQRLAAFSRLVVFDKRGTGLSDRVSVRDLPTLEQRMDDMRAVMDAAGVERAALFGVSEGGPMSALFAATYPERVTALAMYGSYARWVRDVDYPWAPSLAQHERVAGVFEQQWGTDIGIDVFAPSMLNDEIYRQWWARMLRMAASPGAAVALLRMNIQIDIRNILPSIRVPTLVLHRVNDRLIRVECGRHLAEHIPGAKYVELPGNDHVAWVNSDDTVDEVQEFFTGVRPLPESERVLATVLFTDIVGSTDLAVRLGDRQWRELLERHHERVRRELARFRGREVKTAGDGFLATFDGPARAVRCAAAIRDGLSGLGLTIRAGVHTGECEMMGDDIGGIAVHIGSRIAALAAPAEVLVSSTVRDLVAGSGLSFEDRGRHALKGVPGDWQLYRATA